MNTDEQEVTHIDENGNYTGCFGPRPVQAPADDKPKGKAVPGPAETKDIKGPEASK